MRHRPAVRACWGAVLALLPFTAIAIDTRWQLQDISGGGVFQTALAVNGSGTVAGGSDDGQVYVGGAGLVPQRLDGPWVAGFPQPGAFGLDINDAGEVAGTWITSTGQARGFRHDSARGTHDLGVDGLRFATFDDAGAVHGLQGAEVGVPAPGLVRVDRGGTIFRRPSPVPLWSLAGVRDDGAHVANRYVSAARPSVAGVLADGLWQDLPLGTAPTATSTANDFNDAGVVVGDMGVATPGGWDDLHAFVHVPGRGTVDLAAAMGEFIPTSTAAAVNGHGLVVGHGARTSEWRTFSFIYDVRTGSFAQLATALVGADGWSNLFFTDVNDAGQIAGWGQFQGQSRAFLLSPIAPVPEPAQALLLATGVAAVAAFVRQRRRVP